MKRMIVVGAALGMLMLASCASREVPREKAAILHVVLVKLKDPSHVDDAYRDTKSVLHSVGSARSLTRGFAYDTGRKEVGGDYDLALLMDFPDRGAYERYLRSAEHQKLLSVWRDHIASLRIFDIGCEATDDPNALMKNRGVVGPLAPHQVP